MKKALIFVIAVSLFLGVNFGVGAGSLAQQANAVETANNSGFNRAPYFIDPRRADFTIGTGQEIGFSVFASDPDYHTVTYRAFNLPAGAIFNLDTRVFVWRPNSDQAGRYQITFRASDPWASTDLLVTINIEGAVNRPEPANTSTTYPVVNAGNVSPAVFQFFDFNPPLVAAEGQLYFYTVKTAGGNGSVSYRLIIFPAGMTINPTLGMILWTPNYSQGRVEPYPITVAISDGRTEISRSFGVTVQDVSQPSVPSGANIIQTTKTVYVDRSVPEKLKIYNLQAERDADGRVFIVWGTNRSATSRVIYGRISQSDKTDGFTYENATAEDRASNIIHRVQLGKLESEITYYFRAVSQATGESAVSGEGVIIQLGDGRINFSLASLFGAAGGFILGHPFMLLVVIAALALFVVTYRRRQI